MSLLSPRRLATALALTVLLGLAGCAPEPLAVPAATGEQSVAPNPTSMPATAAPTHGMPTASAGADDTVKPESEAAVTSDDSATPTPTAAEPVTSATPTVTLLPAAVLAPGDTGEDVRDLQHRLLQLEWYSGTITENFGEQTQLAVEGFQTKRGLPALGFVDEATWDRLVAMTRTPTHDEMFNVVKPGPALLAAGAKGDAVKDLQARLKQIAWYDAAVDGVYGPSTLRAVSGFQGKREIPVTGDVDQRTLDRLRAMTRTPTTDDLNNVVPTKQPDGMTLDDRCLNGRVVCISKAQRKLAWVVDGEIRLTMDVRFGSELTPTRNGAFSVNWKSRNHVSRLYKTAMPYALFFSGGQAVHFSADFAARGYNGSSHGCVNVRNKEAVSALFDATREGDKVIVYPG